MSVIIMTATGQPDIEAPRWAGVLVGVQGPGCGALKRVRCHSHHQDRKGAARQMASRWARQQWHVSCSPPVSFVAIGSLQTRCPSTDLLITYLPSLCTSVCSHRDELELGPRPAPVTFLHMAMACLHGLLLKVLASVSTKSFSLKPSHYPNPDPCSFPLPRFLMLAGCS